MTAMSCPSNEQLRALSLGQLSAEESDDLIAHVGSCTACQSDLETENDVADSLITSLRDVDDLAQFDAEPNCQVARAKALAALADHPFSDDPAEQRGQDSLAEFPHEIGEYEILRPLGRGGMGNVYLARHTKLGREVALKVLARHRLGDRRVQDRFEAEMQAVGRLSHPNIVTAHDAREIDGTAVLVTEYIDGFDLGELLRRTGPLATADACEIVRQIAVALEYTSGQGFVHRDVKPSNIMLSQTGDVKLLDLGLARFQFSESDRSELTGVGHALGTADFIAPEQVTDSRAVDVRADIYSLGCTLFKLLTGAGPFSDDRYATAFAKMTAHVSTAPPTLAECAPETPNELTALVNAMLAKDLDSRPQTPMQVAQRLASFCAGSDLPALAQSAAESEPSDHRVKLPSSAAAAPSALPLLQRRAPIAALIAAALAAFAIGFAFGVVVRIRYADGTEATINVPSGGQVTIEDRPTDGSSRQDADALDGSPAPPDHPIPPPPLPRKAALQAALLDLEEELEILQTDNASVNARLRAQIALAEAKAQLADAEAERNALRQQILKLRQQDLKRATEAEQAFEEARRAQDAARTKPADGAASPPEAPSVVLEGLWLATSVIDGGQESQNESPTLLGFHRDKFCVAKGDGDGDVELAGTFTIFDAEMGGPHWRAIDLHDDIRGKLLHGAARMLPTGQLQIVIDENRGPRPTEFAAESGSPHALITMERIPFPPPPALQSQLERINALLLERASPQDERPGSEEPPDGHSGLLHANQPGEQEVGRSAGPQGSIAELQQLAVIAQQRAEERQIGYDAGNFSEHELVNAQIQLAEARARLAEATRDRTKVSAALQKLLQLHQRSIDAARQRFEVGAAVHDEVLAAEEALLKSRIRLNQFDSQPQASAVAPPLSLAILEDESVAASIAQLRGTDPIVVNQHTWYPVAKDVSISNARHGADALFAPLENSAGSAISWTDIDGHAQLLPGSRGGHDVDLQFDPELAERIMQLSAANINRRLAILLNGRIIAAPYIVTPIAERTRISGCTPAEIAELAKALGGTTDLDETSTPRTRLARFLQGVWRDVEGYEASNRLICGFHQDQFCISRRGQIVGRGVFEQINSDDLVKLEIDFHDTEKGVMRGVVRLLPGGIVQMCLNETGGPRPTSFELQEGKTPNLLVQLTLIDAVSESTDMQEQVDNVRAVLRQAIEERNRQSSTERNRAPLSRR